MEPTTATTLARLARRWTPARLLATFTLALGFGLVGGAGVVHADRFGPPWMAAVIADRTTAYTQPDRSSPPSGPLRKDAVVVVLEKPGEWTRTHVGFVPSADLSEKLEPWTARVVAEQVAVRARPNGGSEVRRRASQGQLLRVTGVSPGLDGDTGAYWSTTEGYVPLEAIRVADPNDHWVRSWTLPGADEADGGWWGEVSAEANVRAGPTTDAPIVGEFAGGERVKVLGEEQGMDVGGNPKWYRVDGGRFAGARVHSSLIRRIEAPKPTGLPPDAGDAGQGAAIVIDRPSNTLTLLRDGQPRFTTYVALGKAGKETPAGRYRAIAKFRADDMTSTTVPDAERSYDLPNVPFAQYYKEDGQAIHGTYWHDLFGTDQSQGCVNVTWADSAYLFAQTEPDVPADTNARWAGGEQATPVFILG
jgi:hypothetical protein